MEGDSLAALLGAPCRVHGVRVGEVAGVYVDPDRTRVLGLDVRSPGEVRRFLPWLVVERDNGAVNVRSAFLLVDAGDSYVHRGAREIDDADELSELRARTDGSLVSAGRLVGTPIR